MSLNRRAIFHAPVPESRPASRLVVLAAVHPLLVYAFYPRPPARAIAHAPLTYSMPMNATADGTEQTAQPVIRSRTCCQYRLYFLIRRNRITFRYDRHSGWVITVRCETAQGLPLPLLRCLLL
ncbi:hypothetical protein BKA62DRAFT_721595 [Auriculariales sp. MPI-PUGE-AT-0066]|nr:hypothetical protein BKA62DRAFT_721595 [Auriculariales sp. MPI-PUGE-AT-0066]